MMLCRRRSTGSLCPGSVLYLGERGQPSYMKPTLRQLAWALVLPALPLAFSACGSGRTVRLDGGPGGPPAAVATLEQIQREVFTPYCASCHSNGGSGPMPLTDVATSYA